MSGAGDQLFRTHDPAFVVIRVPRRELELIAGFLKEHADSVDQAFGDADGSYIRRLANKLEVASKKE